jgi:hypothetical protein
VPSASIVLGTTSCYWRKKWRLIYATAASSRSSTSPRRSSSSSSSCPPTSRPPSTAAIEQPRLTGKNIALIFEKASTRTRCAFEVAAYDQGAHVTYLGPSGSQIGHKESMKDTARVLGRMYDGIEYRGFGQESGRDPGPARRRARLERPDRPVPPHPADLADILTMIEHSDKPAGPDRLLLPGRRAQQHGQLADGHGLQDGHGRAPLRP